MLTTISNSGQLNSRSMAPVSTESLDIKFIGNLASGKFDELNSNSQVNISFSNPSSTNWISISGEAKIITKEDDLEKIKDLWTKDLESWFGDLNDGVHRGDYKDPRVGLISIHSNEVRYFINTSTALGQAFEVSVFLSFEGVKLPLNFR